MVPCSCSGWNSDFHVHSVNYWAHSLFGWLLHLLRLHLSVPVCLLESFSGDILLNSSDDDSVLILYFVESRRCYANDDS